MTDYFIDGSDLYLADKKIVIMFESMATGRPGYDMANYHSDDPLAQERQFANVAVFKSFVTSFSDSFSSDWTPTQVFGRNDPIYNFKATTRSISLVFDVVATGLEDAILNLTRVGRLAKMLYPAYTAPTDIAANLTRPPLVKIRFANLISDLSTPGSTFTAGTGYGGSPSTSMGGLLGVIKSLSITPDMDAGVFDGPGNAEIYPKIISISVDFGVLHQTELGWDAGASEPKFVGDKFPGGGFPYGAVSSDLKPFYDEDIEVAVIQTEDPGGGGGGDDYYAYEEGQGPLLDFYDYDTSWVEAQTYADEMYGEVELTGLPGEPGYGVMIDDPE